MTTMEAIIHDLQYLSQEQLELIHEYILAIIAADKKRKATMQKNEAS